MVGFIGELSSEDDDKIEESPKEEKKEEPAQQLEVPSFKKEKEENKALVDTYTNTSPHETKSGYFKKSSDKGKKDNFVML